MRRGRRRRVAKPHPFDFEPIMDAQRLRRAVQNYSEDLLALDYEVFRPIRKKFYHCMRGIGNVQIQNKHNPLYFKEALQMDVFLNTFEQLHHLEKEMEVEWLANIFNINYVKPSSESWQHLSHPLVSKSPPLNPS